MKWYNPDKGFGFIGLDTSEQDVFVHATALTRSGLAALAEGQKVTVTFAKGHKGLEDEPSGQCDLVSRTRQVCSPS